MIVVGHKAPFYMEIGVRLRIYKIEQFSSALELDLRQFPQIARIIQNIIMAITKTTTMFHPAQQEKNRQFSPPRKSGAESYAGQNVTMNKTLPFQNVTMNIQ